MSSDPSSSPELSSESSDPSSEPSNSSVTPISSAAHCPACAVSRPSRSGSLSSSLQLFEARPPAPSALSVGKWIPKASATLATAFCIGPGSIASAARPLTPRTSTNSAAAARPRMVVREVPTVGCIGCTAPSSAAFAVAWICAPRTWGSGASASDSISSTTSSNCEKSSLKSVSCGLVLFLPVPRRRLPNRVTVAVFHSVTSPPVSRSFSARNARC